MMKFSFLFLPVFFLLSSPVFIQANEESAMSLVLAEGVKREAVLPVDALMEQQFGGKLITYPEVQEYLSKLTPVQVTVVDHPKSSAWAFSPDRVILTRGMLYEIANEQELKALIAQAATVKGGVQELTKPVLEQGVSSPAFTKAMDPFLGSQEAYEKLFEGYAAIERGEAELALRISEELLGDLDGEPHLLGLLAKVRQENGSSPGALIELKKALRLNPDYYDFYLQRGLIFQQVGLLDGARVDLEKSLELYPTDTAYLALGMIALKECNYEEASAYFSKVERDAERVAEAQAKREIAQIMSEPSKHLDVTGTLNAQGYLTVHVLNKSHYDLNRLVVSVTEPSTSHQIKFGEQILKPSRRSSLLTKIGPFDSSKELSEQLLLSVSSLRVI